MHLLNCATISAKSGRNNECCQLPHKEYVLIVHWRIQYFNQLGGVGEKEKVFYHIQAPFTRSRTGETVTVSIYPVSKYLRKDEAKRNRVDL
jgi:hypothetical protein